MPQEKEKERDESFGKKHKNALCGIFAAFFAVLLGGAVFFFRSTPPPSPPLPVAGEANGIGIVDLVRAERAHEAYAQIADLEAQRAAIAADIAWLDARRRALQTPTLIEEPFRLAAAQKALQQERLVAEAQARERRRALAAWEEETNDAFLAEKKALEDTYQNRLVNIEMKIDNRAAMLLTATEVKALVEEMETLRKERSAYIEALFAAREEEKQRYLSELVAREEEIEKSGVSAQEEALRQQAEAERRNSEALWQAMQGIEIDELLRQKQAALAAKDEEIRIICAYIRRDIESKTAKLALVHHLALVVAKETDEVVNVPRFDAKTSGLHFPVTTFGALDLTEEVIAELSQGTILERSGKS